MGNSALQAVSESNEAREEGSAGVKGAGLSARELLPLIAGLSVTFLPPFFQIPAFVYSTVMRGFDTTPSEAWALVESAAFATAPAAILAIVICWERKPLSSIGLRRVTSADLFVALMIFITYLLAMAALLQIRRLHAGLPLIFDPGSVPMTQLSIQLRVAMSVTNGIGEEMGARGFAIERLEHLTGNKVLGAGLPYVASVCCHIPFWGIERLPDILIGQSICVLYYLRRRSLAGNMLGHVLCDAYPMIVWPLLPMPIRCILG